MAGTLEQFDARVGAQQSFALVPELQFEESGVDPVGMRQLNLDLMDAAAPGINNITSYIRPYAFMAWAWSKARRVASRNDTVDPHSDVMRDLVARYEVLYAWSHCVAGAPGLAGYTILRRHLPLKGDARAFRFRGAKWEALRTERDANTGIMAAVQYGPSIKALRWLLPGDDRTFRNSLQVADAVAAIDAIVAAHVPERLLALDPPEVTAEDVEPFQLHLNVLASTASERRCFRTLFYELGEEAAADGTFIRRRSTLDLICGLLGEEGAPLASDDLRRNFASARSPALLPPEREGPIKASIATLAVLQARQLQRLAVEAMLVWTEHMIAELGGVATTDQLAERAHAQAIAADAAATSGTVRAYLDAVTNDGEGWPTAGDDEDADFLRLTQSIESAQAANRAGLPALCLRAFAAVYAATHGLRRWGIEEGPNDPLSGRSDRLPLDTLAKTLDASSDQAIPLLWRRIVESWVIGQHVRWSALRGGDGKKRLRVALDSGGWIRVRKGFSGPFEPTQDRLDKLLMLGAECGLFERLQSDGSELRYSLTAPA